MVIAMMRDLQLGVLTVFAEAQAWAHEMIHGSLAERAALSARAHNRGRSEAQKPKEAKEAKAPRAPKRAPRAKLTRAERNAKRQEWRERNRKAGRACDHGA